MTGAGGKPRNALYLLPNAFTTGALFAGFYAILQSIVGNWEWAATGVIIAAALDACDGRVARLTNTQSQFGVEYDSLADVVSFGVAPAILLYQWQFAALGKVGFSIAFLLCAATALRLARFNTFAGKVDRRFFIGLPSPMAAIIVVSYVACVEQYEWAVSPYLTAMLSVAVSVTMLSAARFYSFKTMGFLRNRSPLYMGFALTAVFAFLYAVWNEWMLLIFLSSIGYFIAGWSYAGWQFLRRRSSSFSPPPPSS